MAVQDHDPTAEHWAAATPPTTITVEVEGCVITWQLGPHVMTHAQLMMNGGRTAEGVSFAFEMLLTLALEQVRTNVCKQSVTVVAVDTLGSARFIPSQFPVVFSDEEAAAFLAREGFRR